MSSINNRNCLSGTPAARLELALWAGLTPVGLPQVARLAHHRQLPIRPGDTYTFRIGVTIRTGASKVNHSGSTPHPRVYVVVCELDSSLRSGFLAQNEDTSQSPSSFSTTSVDRLSCRFMAYVITASRYPSITTYRSPRWASLLAIRLAGSGPSSSRSTFTFSISLCRAISVMCSSLRD